MSTRATVGKKDWIVFVAVFLGIDVLFETSAVCWTIASQNVSIHAQSMLCTPQYTRTLRHRAAHTRSRKNAHKRGLKHTRYVRFSPGTFV